MGKTVFLETFPCGGSRDTLHYCQGLIETLKKTKLVISFFFTASRKPYRSRIITEILSIEKDIK